MLLCVCIVREYVWRTRPLPTAAHKLGCLATLVQFLLCAHAQGVKQSVLSVVCRLSARKSPDLDFSTSEHSVSTTKQSITVKNLLMFAWNHLARLTGSTNRVFLLAMPINHNYNSCPCKFYTCTTSWSGIGR